MFTKTTFPLALAIGAAVACGGAGGNTGPTQSSNNPPNSTPPTTTNSNTVTVTDNAFNPTAVTVATGATVTWKWAQCTDGGYGDGYGGGYGSGSGGACTTHNVTFDDGSNIASQTQASGEFSRTFAAAGTYKFHCSIHGAAAMSGQIVVK